MFIATSGLTGSSLDSLRPLLELLVPHRWILRLSDSRPDIYPAHRWILTDYPTPDRILIPPTAGYCDYPTPGRISIPPSAGYIDYPTPGRIFIPPTAGYWPTIRPRPGYLSRPPRDTATTWGQPASKASWWQQGWHARSRGEPCSMLRRFLLLATIFLAVSALAQAEESRLTFQLYKLSRNQEGFYGVRSYLTLDLSGKELHLQWLSAQPAEGKAEPVQRSFALAETSRDELETSAAESLAAKRNLWQDLEELQFSLNFMQSGAEVQLAQLPEHFLVVRHTRPGRASRGIALSPAEPWSTLLIRTWESVPKEVRTEALEALPDLAPYLTTNKSKVAS